MSVWPLYPIKAIASYNDEVLPEDTPPDSEIRYLEISDVQYGEPVSWPDPIMFGDAPSRARRRVRSGDLLVSTVRTYLRAVTHVEDAPENAIASTGFAVLRPYDVDSRFLGYAMLAQPVIDEIVSRSVGISYPAIKASDLVAVKIPVPSPSRQLEILRYLERETAEIDAFISDQENLVALLEERRLTLINNLVRRGLGGTEMRSSGVPWLGEVPAHWRILSGRRLFRERRENPRAGDVQLAASQKFGLIAQDELLSQTGYRVVAVQKNSEILKRVASGDFVISMRSFQGGLEYARSAGKVSSAYVPLVPITAIEPLYFRYLFKSVGYISALRATSNLVRDGQAMRFANFSQVPVPVPPVAEQATIAAYIAQEVGALWAADEDARKAIVLSKERRAALISAAVTGQIDVSERKRVLV